MKTIEIKSLEDLSPILSRIEYLLENIACYFSLIGENISISNKVWEVTKIPATAGRQ